jgi:formylmethanofuran dehydrogenase subunit B
MTVVSEASPTPASVVCAGCACLCDDVTVARDNGRLGVAEVPCEAGRRFLGSLGGLEPSARIAGKPTGIAEAVTAAAALLRAAAAPAVIGLSGLTVEACREAVHLAEALRGLLIPWPSDPARQWGLLGPDLARTFGEIRNRADLIVFWRCDPARTHPRHLERISAEPRGRFLPNGRADRTIVVVDEPNADNRTAGAANAALRFARDQDPDALARLRLHLEKNEPAPEALRPLTDALARARCAHIFLDPATAVEPALMQQFHLLAANLHKRVRTAISMLGIVPNRRGATEVVSWQAGFPGPVSFASGAPEYRPDGWEADRVLAEGLCDAVVCAGMEAAALPAPARANLSRLPRVVLAPAADPAADVAFVVPGLDPRLHAHVIRSDGIMLRLCGAGGGLPDPAVELLAAIRGALGGGE